MAKKKPEKKASDDQFLRDAGFKIHSRRRGREPEWKIDDVIMSQSEALDYVHDLKEAEKV